MTFVTGRLEQETMARAALATAFNQARPLVVPGRLRRAAGVVGDLFAAVGIVLCVPLVILAIGIPIALCVRLLLWIGGLFRRVGDGDLRRGSLHPWIDHAEIKLDGEEFFIMREDEVLAVIETG